MVNVRNVLLYVTCSSRNQRYVDEQNCRTLNISNDTTTGRNFPHSVSAVLINDMLSSFMHLFILLYISNERKTLILIILLPCILTLTLALFILLKLFHSCYLFTFRIVAIVINF